jgi:uncharacterized protein (TIGR02145 family)
MKINLLILWICISLFSLAQESSSFRDDRDGKIYKTITIEGKTWMAENLAIQKGEFWSQNDDPLYRVQYGYVYTIKSALKLCPEGWHLPSDEDWVLLEIALGGKEGRQNLNTKAKVIFNQLGGYRDAINFNTVGFTGRWWSSTKDKLHSSKTETDYWIREFNPSGSGFSRTFTNSEQACSVRCVKD